MSSHPAYLTPVRDGCYRVYMDETQYRDPGRPGTHPNSLEAKAANDPALRQQLSAGRKEARRNERAMKEWEKQGFLSDYPDESSDDWFEHVDDPRELLDV